MNQLKSSIDKQDYNFNKRLNQLNTIEDNYKKAVGYYYKSKEKQGSWIGGIGASLASGITAFPKYALNKSADILTEIIPYGGLNPVEYNEMKMDGLSDSEIKDRVSAKLKRTVVRDIEEGIIRVGSLGNTTSEYLGSEDRGMIQQAVNGLAESIGASVSGGGNKISQGLAFFAMSANTMESELAGKEFDSMSKWEKGAVSGLYVS